MVYQTYWWTIWNQPDAISLSEDHNDSVRHHTLWTGSTRDGQNWLAFHMQVSCRRVWSTTHSGVGGQTGSAQIWSTIQQQLRVPDLPPDVSLTDWASCPQQVTLVMIRPVVSTAQSMISLAEPRVKIQQVSQYHGYQWPWRISETLVSIRCI